MPFPYDFPFDFDVGIVGTPLATITRMGLMGTIMPETHIFPTAAITRVAMLGAVSQEETIAGVVTEKQGLSGVVE